MKLEQAVQHSYIKKKENTSNTKKTDIKVGTQTGKLGRKKERNGTLL